MEGSNELPPRLEARLSRMPPDQQHIFRPTFAALLALPWIRDRLVEHGELAPEDVRALWEHAAATWTHLCGRDPSEFLPEDRFDAILPLLNPDLWLHERFPEGGSFSDRKHYPPTPEGELERLRLMSATEQFAAAAIASAERMNRPPDSSD